MYHDDFDYNDLLPDLPDFPSQGTKSWLRRLLAWALAVAVLLTLLHCLTH